MCIRDCVKVSSLLKVIVHTYIPNTKEIEIEGSRIRDQPMLCSELEANLSHRRLYFKGNKHTQKISSLFPFEIDQVLMTGLSHLTQLRKPVCLIKLSFRCNYQHSVLEDNLKYVDVCCIQSLRKNTCYAVCQSLCY